MSNGMMAHPHKQTNITITITEDLNSVDYGNNEWFAVGNAPASNYVTIIKSGNNATNGNNGQVWAEGAPLINSKSSGNDTQLNAVASGANSSWLAVGNVIPSGRTTLIYDSLKWESDGISSHTAAYGVAYNYSNSTWTIVEDGGYITTFNSEGNYENETKEGTSNLHDIAFKK